VPSLLFEEKESKTIQALLVSPASIGQVVLGKALAGFFYILVTAAMIFLIFWQDVTHWSMAILFIISGGTFSVAVGLMLGSFFEKQQDVLGWMMAVLLLLVGALLIKMLGVELPTFLDQILPWIPSVAISEIYRASFSETIPVTQVLNNLWIVLSISMPLYGLVIWKVRRSDR
jgi:ABC-2 type transport system permease protein